MKKLHSWMPAGLAILILISSVAIRAPAQSIPPGAVWSYTLVNGSQLIDDCPLCDRPTIMTPLRGTFQLRLLQPGPLFSTYALENIALTGGDITGRLYKITGEGTLRLGGELAFQESLFLQVSIDNGFTNQLCYFTNALHFVTRFWPMIQESVDQTNGTPAQQFHIDLNAAPFHQLWFSTTGDFFAGIWNSPTNSVSPGDLISTTGCVVKKNSQLTSRLGIMPPAPNLGLKDMDILRGGEVAFSIEQSIFSETLGTLHPGDLLSDRGRVLRTNAQLIAAFLPAKPVPSDVGLAAVQVMQNGEIWFSVQTNFFSSSLNRMIQPGDLLSDNGTLVRSNAALLAQFHPVNPTDDFGLKTAYIWPSGEIWFSTAQGFYDSNSRYYASGDLLSDQGYLVYSNVELLSVFQPFNSTAGLGLDASFVITDVTPPSPPPKLNLPQSTNQPPASLSLHWSASGRVFQLERAINAAGPYLPLNPITTDTVFIDSGARTNQSQAFYRLRQW